MNIENPQFTETLQTLLDNQGYGTQEQTASLTEIINLMDKFPTFVFSDTITFTMKDLFIAKYDIREIGAPTEDLFMHFWREKTNELLMKYAPKMQKWLENFDDLFKFTVKLERDDTFNGSTNNKNTYYLNPVNTTTENLKVQDVEGNDSLKTVLLIFCNIYLLSLLRFLL